MMGSLFPDIDPDDRIDIPARERPLMPNVHNIAGEHRGELGPNDNDDEKE